MSKAAKKTEGKKDKKANSDAPEENVFLARVTGELGDRETITSIGADLTRAYVEFLPEVFQVETGIEIRVGFVGVEMGRLEELVEDLGDTVVFCNASLRGWSTDFVIGCSSTLVMVVVEAMLGAPVSEIVEPEPRPLSKIELDLANVIFTRIAGILRSVIEDIGRNEPVLEFPHNADDRKPRPEGYRDPHAAAVTMKIKIGDIISNLYFIVPQRSLLKGKVIVPASLNGPRTRKEWTDKLQDQVQRSTVEVEARIKLQELPLRVVSRLQEGDVIPFSDLQEVRVEVRANGKDMYVGEFGRSGENYMVRVKDTYGDDVDLLAHLMS